ERTTPGGFKRLIALSDPHFDQSPQSKPDMLGVDVNQIGVLKGDYRILHGNWRKLNMAGIASPGEIRIFAGQVDPKDASRFSIPFEARGRKGWIDCQFVDGESSSKDPAMAKIDSEVNAGVEFSIRMEPAPSTQPAS